MGVIDNIDTRETYNLNILQMFLVLPDARELNIAAYYGGNVTLKRGFRHISVCWNVFPKIAAHCHYLNQRSCIRRKFSLAGKKLTRQSNV